MVLVLYVRGGVSGDLNEDKSDYSFTQHNSFEAARDLVVAYRTELEEYGFHKAPGDKWHRGQEWAKVLLIDDHGVEWR